MASILELYHFMYRLEWLDDFVIPTELGETFPVKSN